MSCDCDYMKELEQESRKRALSEWKDGRRDVKFESWNYECGDGCCVDWGTSLIINDHQLTEHFDGDENDVLAILDFFNIETEDIDFEYCDAD